MDGGAWWATVHGVQESDMTLGSNEQYTPENPYKLVIL